MAMLARKFNKYLRMKKFENGRKPQRKDISKEGTSKREKDPIVCYECKKPSHIKFDCPFLKKQNSRKKAIKAIWSDSDTSDDDESMDEKITNLCFMALEEQKVTSNSCDSNPYTFDELQDAFGELAIDFEYMNLKYKKMIFKLNVENELLTNAKIDLEKKIDYMKVEIDELIKKNVN